MTLGGPQTLGNNQTVEEASFVQVTGRDERLDEKKKNVFFFSLKHSIVITVGVTVYGIQASLNSSHSNPCPSGSFPRYRQRCSCTWVCVYSLGGKEQMPSQLMKWLDTFIIINIVGSLGSEPEAALQGITALTQSACQASRWSSSSLYASGPTWAGVIGDVRSSSGQRGQSNE